MTSILLDRPTRTAAILVFAGALATILGAWAFQLIAGYIPCALCLGQRIPYYVGVPVALAAMVAALAGYDRAARILLLVVAGIFLWSVYLGVFHAGVEWKWWEGPADCGGTNTPISRTAGSLLNQLQDIRIVSCTEASWRFPDGWGLSFAGWNAVISTGIVIVSLLGATMRRRSA